MSKPVTQFTIDCWQGTNWKLRVFVWPTLKILRAQRTNYEEIKENICIAFCRPIEFVKARKDGIIAEMHFHRGEITPALVAHEAAHALVWYSNMVRLDLNTRSGDEQFAEAVEHVLSGTLWSFRKFIKRKRKK